MFYHLANNYLKSSFVSSIKFLYHHELSYSSIKTHAIIKIYNWFAYLMIIHYISKQIKAFDNVNCVQLTIHINNWTFGK